MVSVMTLKTSLLSLAGLTWRSPQAVATMTVCRLTLPELWKPQSHLRWALFLSGTCGSVSIPSNWMYLFMLVLAHLQALDEHSGLLLRALHAGDRLLPAPGELHQRQSAVGSGTNGEGVKFSVLASGIWPACVGSNQEKSKWKAGNEWFDCPALSSPRCVWHCCSWKAWRTATMNSCPFHSGPSPSIHLASCKEKKLNL